MKERHYKASDIYFNVAMSISAVCTIIMAGMLVSVLVG
jgi:hypothetical protein